MSRVVDEFGCLGSVGGGISADSKVEEDMSVAIGDEEAVYWCIKAPEAGMLGLPENSRCKVNQSATISK
jgi:hypothetical protein